MSTNGLRQVAITKLNIISPIKSNTTKVTESLRKDHSSIIHSNMYEKISFQSHIHNAPNVNLDTHINRKLRRFMNNGTAYNYITMQQAIADSNLTNKNIHNEHTNLIIKSGKPSTSAQVKAANIAHKKNPKQVNPYAIPKAMYSTLSANISTAFKMHGLSYSINSTCSTNAHYIGNNSKLIQISKQDIIFTNSAKELHQTLSVLFNTIGTLSSKYNNTPEKASHAYNANHDSFVITNNANVIVLEDIEHAKAHGTKIYTKLVSYNTTSNNVNIVTPSGEGAVHCIKMTITGLNSQPINYINTHGTSTPVSNMIELAAIHKAFGTHSPYISSTKSLTKHSQGATGTHKAIYSLLMIENNFITTSANIEKLDPNAENAKIIHEQIDNAKLNTIISNSFSFSNTNTTLAFQQHEN